MKFKFSVDGVERTLVECNDKWAIYSLPSNQGFELHKLRWRDGNRVCYRDTIVDYPSGFVLASTSDFGKYGWNCSTFDRCYQKLVELNLLDNVSG